MKIVGIIGGLGPETTAEFYLDVIFSCQRDYKVSRPNVLISSVPLPYKIEEDLITKNTGGERYIPYLTEEAQRLEKAGADFLVIPCNTVHVFINEVRKSVNIPVLSIIEETVKFININKFKKVGIVATLTTIKSKLYETNFQKEGIEYLKPNNKQQDKIGKIILNLVTGKVKDEDRSELIKIIDDFKPKEVDCVALACTDFQLLITEHNSIKIFDTMKVLADATVRELLRE